MFETSLILALPWQFLPAEAGTLNPEFLAQTRLQFRLSQA